MARKKYVTEEKWSIELPPVVFAAFIVAIIIAGLFAYIAAVNATDPQLRAFVTQQYNFSESECVSGNRAEFCFEMVEIQTKNHFWSCYNTTDPDSLWLAKAVNEGRYNLGRGMKLNYYQPFCAQYCHTTQIPDGQDCIKFTNVTMTPKVIYSQCSAELTDYYALGDDGFFHQVKNLSVSCLPSGVSPSPPPPYITSDKVTYIDVLERGLLFNISRSETQIEFSNLTQTLNLDSIKNVSVQLLQDTPNDVVNFFAVNLLTIKDAKNVTSCTPHYKNVTYGCVPGDVFRQAQELLK